MPDTTFGGDGTADVPALALTPCCHYPPQPGPRLAMLPDGSLATAMVVAAIRASAATGIWRSAVPEPGIVFVTLTHVLLAIPEAPRSMRVSRILPVGPIGNGDPTFGSGGVAVVDVAASGAASAPRRRRQAGTRTPERGRVRALPAEAANEGRRHGPAQSVPSSYLARTVTIPRVR